jgi:hypothetical protein
MHMSTLRDATLVALLFGGVAIAAIVPALDREGPGALSAGSASPAATAGPANAPKWTPPPSPVPTATPDPGLPSTRGGVPAFKEAAVPYDLALGTTCRVQEAHLYGDELGEVWRIQCGSAAANLAIAAGADTQGWHFENGDRPDGFQNFTQGDLLMQIVYRRDGPGAADQVTVVQRFRPSTQGSDYPDGLASSLSPRCSILGAPVKGDATDRTWQGRCGGDLTTAFDEVGRLIAPLGFTPISASQPPYQVRAWCGPTRLIAQWGAGLAAGTFLLTQTRLATSGACTQPR